MIFRANNFRFVRRLSSLEIGFISFYTDFILYQEGSHLIVAKVYSIIFVFN